MKWKKSLAGLSSYKPGKREEEVMAELGLTKITKLSSNENPLGTSPKVAALQANSNVETEIYPDGWASSLRTVVADFYQLEEEELIFTAGVDELIELLTRVLLDTTKKYSDGDTDICAVSSKCVNRRRRSKRNSATCGWCA